MSVNENQNLRQQIDKLEQLLKSTQETANAGHWEFDFKTETFHCSDDLCSILNLKNGKSRKSFEKFRSCIHPEDRPEIEEKYADLLQTHSSNEATYRLQVNNGNEKFIKEKCAVITDKNGNISQTIGVIADITATNNYQKQLQLEKEFNDSIFNTMPGIFCLFSKTGKLLKWNKNLEKISGMTPEEIRKKLPVDFFSENDKRKMLHALNTTLKKGEMILEAEFQDKNKNHTPYLFSGKRIRRDDEWLLLGVGIDISKRKEAEKGRERLLEDLNERMKEITCLFRINELFQSKTKDLKPLLQRAANIIPKGWLHPDYTSAEIVYDSIVAQSYIFKESRDFLTEKIYTGNVERGYVKVYVAAPDENQNYFLKEEKSLLKQISISLGQLIQKLESEKAFKEKNQLLEDSNASKNLLISIISHDLRGPVNSIINLLDIVETEFDTIDKKILKNYIQAIQSSAKNTRDLMENLLDWARVQSKKQKVEASDYKAKRIIKKNIVPLKSAADSKNIQLNIQVEKDLTVFADKKMIGTVVRNLVSNALKFTPKDGKVIVSAKRENDQAVFSVEDTGIGMDKEIREKLFKVEKTVSSPGTENEPGSGFGLVLCKEFVEKNNGQISVKSEPNKGTIVYFNLPLSAE